MVQYTTMLVAVFTFGLAVGSFLNAYIFRLRESTIHNSPQPSLNLREGDKGRIPPLRLIGSKTGRASAGPGGKGGLRSVWRGRSYCPKCKKQLYWYELIPLVSFLIQLGRCRGCKKQIDWQYPLVELATGILFLLAYYQLPAYLLTSVPTYLIICYLLSALVVLFVYDLRYGLVPDKVVLPAIGIAALYTVIASVAKQSAMPFAISHLLLAIAIGAGFFALQYYLSKGRWLGAGDIRLGALMGAMVGWPFIVEALVISYLIGGVFAGVLLILGKKRFGQTLPLGTFLTLGTAIVFLYGEQIWRAYWR